MSERASDVSGLDITDQHSLRQEPLACPEEQVLRLLKGTTHESSQRVISSGLPLSLDGSDVAVYRAACTAPVPGLDTGKARLTLAGEGSLSLHIAYENTLMKTDDYTQVRVCQSYSPKTVQKLRDGSSSSDSIQLASCLTAVKRKRSSERPGLEATPMSCSS